MNPSTPPFSTPPAAKGTVGHPAVGVPASHGPAPTHTSAHSPSRDEMAAAASQADPFGAGPHAVQSAADDTEQVYYEGSPLLRGEAKLLFTWGLIGLALILAPFLIPVLTHQPVLPRGVTIAMIAVGAVLLLIPYVMTKTIRYRLTNYRVDFERGIFSKAIDTLELWHVDDIKFHQSLFARVMGVGTIQIIVNDQSSPRLFVRSVPNARNLFETLKQRIIAVKRQPGVVKMDTGH